jgi:hypothetical protein
MSQRGRGVREGVRDGRMRAAQREKREGFAATRRCALRCDVQLRERSGREGS